MSGSGKSVVYVHPVDEDIDLPKVITAQKYALANELPFCVVTVIGKTNIAKQLENLNGLRSSETKLKKYDIPLIGLVGETATVIRGFCGHVSPKKVFICETTPPSHELKLQLHPYKWPGTVIQIDGIIKLLETGSISC
jgi:hypothetical protein